MKKWDEFYDQVMQLPEVKVLKKWCEENDVLFEPYARANNDGAAWEENELMCSCCFYGDLDLEENKIKDYLAIKIGDNGNFEKTNICYDDEDNSYEEEKELDELLKEFKKELEEFNLSHKLSDEKMKKFCKDFKTEITRWKYSKDIFGEYGIKKDKKIDKGMEM